MSLANIQEPPTKSLILLTGTPGAGKSNFCHQIVLNSIAYGRSVIFVTTERSASDIVGILRDRGLAETPPGSLNFVDAFADTVGLDTPDRPDTVYANCEDLNTVNMAIAKQQQNIGRKNIHLFFDSLTSLYLFNREEIFRFLRLSLSKFAAEGNSVVALMDEGCGSEEDLVAMMSIADGIIRLEIKDGSRIINVVKHPKVAPTKIETPVTLVKKGFELKVDMHSTDMGLWRKPVRIEVGEFINVFWRNLVSWSGMLWDPKRFPKMAYELDKEAESIGTERLLSELPWHKRILSKMFLPRRVSEVKDMKRITSQFLRMGEEMGWAISEYLESKSRTDEHHFRCEELSSCWGFDNVGARLAFHDCGEWAGFLKGLEGGERDWNVVETKCIGIGAPYCEMKVVPGETDELKDFLEGIDGSIVEKVHDRLMDQLTEFLIHGKPLPERPKLGGGINFHEMHHVSGMPASISDRYKMALRMGGAKTGKEVSEHLMNAGLKEDEVIKRVIDFMDYCKVGKINVGNTIRINENCETLGLKSDEPFCFFTTGFLNGIYSTVKNQHVREIKCMTTGDPYCEWEII